MIKPLKNHVLISPIVEEQKTKTGVVLPDTVEAKETKKAKVIALGKRIDSQGKIIESEIKKDDIVIHDSYASEIEDKNKKYMVIKYDEILAIIK